MSNDTEKEIILTVSQQRVLDNIERFIADSGDRIFILKGYAGTGKTTLMKFLIDYMEETRQHYHLLASTGRAVKILANLTGIKSGTSTIHSMIYSFLGFNKDLSEEEKPTTDKNGQLFFNFEPAVINESKIPETIYIVDESSMVSDVESKIVTQAKFGTGRLLKELLNYDQRDGSKYIFVGDPCQLPPIEEYFSPALSVDYFKDVFHINAQESQLTEIMRMGNGNSIIAASKGIRSLYNKAPEDSDMYGMQRVWGMLDFRKCNDIILHDSDEDMITDFVSKTSDGDYNRAVCICRSNRKCHEVSMEIRRRLNFTSFLQKGDLLLVIQNNYSTGLMNGDMVVVEDISEETLVRAQLTFRQIKVKELFTQKVYSTLIIEDILNQSKQNLDAAQQNGLFYDFIMRMKRKGIKQKMKKKFEEALLKDPFLNALRCVYGYAITCHKAQGGEWDDVYMIVPGNITLNPTKETYQWIYTAMTRTKKILHMKDAFYIK